MFKEFPQTNFYKLFEGISICVISSAETGTYSSSALTNSSVTADITGQSIAFTVPSNDNGSNELVAVSSTMSVDGGGSSKFYFIVSPSTSKQHKLNFTINGLSRSVSKTLAFEAGKVTKFIVPINDLKHPHISDALAIVSTGSATNGKNVLDLGDAVKANSNEQPTATINGQANVPIYIVGDGNSGTLTLRGSTKDIINALDAGFYASTWSQRRSAMTISNINIWIEGYQIADYPALMEAFKNITVPMVKKILDGLDWFGWLGDHNELAEKAWEEGLDIIGIFTISLKPLVQSLLNTGIAREGALVGLSSFIDPQTITFNGVVENGSSEEDGHIIILHEEHKYKGIDENMVNMFLNDDTKPMGGKFIYNGIKPTYQGLKDIVNSTTSATDKINNNGKTFAENTSYAIYNKLMSTIGNRTFSLPGLDPIKFSDIFNAVFASEADMVAKLPDIEFEIVVSTCDHYDNKAEYGRKNSNGDYIYPLSELQKNNNPIVFWGLDAYGPNKSSLSN